MVACINSTLIGLPENVKETFPKTYVLTRDAHSAKCVLVVVILCARLSVCHDPVPIQAQMSRDSEFSPYDSVESLVFPDKRSCRWVR